MIPKLERFKSVLLGLDDQVNDFIREAFEDNKSVVEDLNIQQLQEGKRSDGQVLPDYSPASVEVYGKPPGAIKLFDEGDFYRGITLDVSENESELSGQESKTAELQFEFGEQIIGLSEESAEEFKNEYIRPTIFEGLKLIFS